MGAYQEGAGNKDEDTAFCVAGLSIEGCDLMLDLLEGKFLKQRRERLESITSLFCGRYAHTQFSNDGLCSKFGIILKGEHRMVALCNAQI